MATHRWIVTYTKHMKQKRKVYQDGVLELCSSTGTPQVILYDEHEKLIDRRFLKKDEIIKSGGTLSFETHIVEIGDTDGSKIPSAESNVKPCIQPESQKEKLFVEWNVLYTTQTTQKVKRYHDGVLQSPAISSHFNLISIILRKSPIIAVQKLAIS
ncbi:hypothetical protein KSP39_PZI019142 [Platanthera zijinensis]|uniref:5'-3' DNA helicase ZGRF1-like N-terminal domain-containing protein n=1 Tax=Platanthera zijinensis TaxID=2320716 RepID=A0AAP0B2B2_9ASPA